MPTITLNLTDDACQGFAEFYSKTDDEQSCEDFVADRLILHVQEAMVEKRNRDAITAAAQEPLPDVVEAH